MATDTPTEEAPVDWLAALLPDPTRRRQWLIETAGHLDRFVDGAPQRPVTPAVTAQALRHHLAAYDFADPRPASAVLADAVELMVKGTVHTNHPRYFGLFNPAPAYPGVLADFITATINPQLAVWSHAPAAVEIERHLIRFIGGLMGLPRETIAGHFTSGGAEANLTALLLATTRAFPAFAKDGARALPGAPRLYASADSHLAWLKIAHATGFGRSAVRLVSTDGSGRMDVAALAKVLAEDRAAGHAPLMVVGTAGTTGSGMIDPLTTLADLCERESLHFHVDAAWGGAAAFSDGLRPCLAGIERAGSVTMDAHKWLAVPMGAGLFLCNDNDGLYETFRVSTQYMPEGVAALDPYTHGMQWSRRGMGFKLFLTLALIGRAGYAALVETQTRQGDRLRRRLVETGWRVVNPTPLPVVCFNRPDGSDPAPVAQRIVESGAAWLSTTVFEGQPVLRACVISHRTRDEDIEELVKALS